MKLVSFIVEACTSSDGVGKTKVTADENKVKEKPKLKRKSVCS